MGQFGNHCVIAEPLGGKQFLEAKLFFALQLYFGLASAFIQNVLKQKKTQKVRESTSVSWLSIFFVLFQDTGAAA